MMLFRANKADKKVTGAHGSPRGSNPYLQTCLHNPAGSIRAALPRTEHWGSGTGSSGAALLSRAPAFVCSSNKQRSLGGSVLPYSGLFWSTRGLILEGKISERQLLEKVVCIENKITRKYFVSTTICTSLKQPHWKILLLPSSPSVNDVCLSRMTALCKGRATSFCVTAVCSHCFSGQMQTVRSWDNSPQLSFFFFLPYLSPVTVIPVSDSTNGLTFQLSVGEKKYKQWE